MIVHGSTKTRTVCVPCSARACTVIVPGSTRTRTAIVPGSTRARTVCLPGLRTACCQVFGRGRQRKARDRTPLHSKQ